MKIIGTVLALLFALFAYFQLNDPDAGLWIGLYGLMALVSALAALGRQYPPLLLATALLAIYTAAISTPGLIENLSNPSGFLLFDNMSQQRPYIEETREFGGTLICLAALLFLQFGPRRGRQ